MLLTTPQYEHAGAMPRTIKSTLPGLSYIKAYLNGVGVKSTVIDPYGENLGLEDTLKRIKEYDTRLYGISATYLDYDGLFSLTREIKKHNPSGRIIVGGWASFSYADLLDTIRDIDIVVVGPGEQTVQELIPAILKGTSIAQIKGIAFRVNDIPYFTGRRQGIVRLDDLLLPDVSDTPPFKFKHSTIFNYYSSRGCPNSCKFCTIGQMHESYNAMSARKVVDDLVKTLYKYPEVDLLSLSDDLFDIRRLPGIIEEMGRRGVPDDLKLLFQSSAHNVNTNERILQDAAIRGRIDRLDMGIETFSDRTLRFFAKPATGRTNWNAVEIVTANNIQSMAYTIIDPTVQEIVDTRQYYVHPHFWPKNIWMNCLKVFPYTRLAKEKVKDTVKPWQVAFQEAMFVFHQFRPSLVELHTLYDKGIAGLRENAEQDPVFRAKYEQFQKKDALMKQETNSVVQSHFDFALEVAMGLQNSDHLPDLKAIVGQKKEEMKASVDRITKLIRAPV
jgi:hypothetical protein